MEQIELSPTVLSVHSFHLLLILPNLLLLIRIIVDSAKTCSLAIHRLRKNLARALIEEGRVQQGRRVVH